MRTKLCYAALGAVVAIVCMLLWQHYWIPGTLREPALHQRDELLSRQQSLHNFLLQDKDVAVPSYFDGIQWERRPKNPAT
jgi:hypothetical protein